ncbi:MAG TPA: DUF3040 domain-containing protein [Amycolatopsis sp.]|nr:DUF3040 domain-containing protein [Amycolatopsis sp.]
MLSPYDRDQLAKIEIQLETSDPELATVLRTGKRRWSRTVLRVLLDVLAVAILVIGLVTGVVSLVLWAALLFGVAIWAHVARR